MDAKDRALLDHIGYAVFAIEPGADGEPRYVAFNRFARETIGRAETEIIGLTAAELYPGRQGRIAYDHHVEALRTGRERTYELPLPLANEQRWVRTTLSPVLDASGRLIRVIGSSTDVSERQVFAEMRAGVETLSGEFAEMLNRAAHELRAPMRNIGAVADLLRDGFQDLGDGKLELIDLMERISTNALDLVSDVLSHAEAVSAVGMIAEFDFAALAREVMAVADPNGDHAFEATPGRVRGDRTATAIALRNLVECAIRTRRRDGGSDGGASRFAFSADTDKRGFFGVSVDDEAGGFDYASVSLLNGGALRTDGAFGLLGVRRLIVARGGRIAALKRSGARGAKIRFTLPGEVVEPALQASDGPAVRHASMT